MPWQPSVGSSQGLLLFVTFVVFPVECCSWWLLVNLRWAPWPSFGTLDSGCRGSNLGLDLNPNPNPLKGLPKHNRLSENPNPRP